MIMVTKPQLLRMGDSGVIRGGPLDILGGGGGVSDPKKKFMQEIEPEKKFLHELEERKKNRATS